MALEDFSAFPSNTTGLAPSPSATSWVAGAWVQMSPGNATDISIISLTFQVTNTPGAGTTREYLFEIGTGAAGAEVTKVQIPYSTRMDTTVGFFLTRAYTIFLPEPYVIPANNRIAVRCYNNAAASLAQSGVKIFYQGGSEAFYNIFDPMGRMGFFGI